MTAVPACAVVACIPGRTAEHIVNVLSEAGYDVNIVHDGAQALELCRKKRPLLVIADAVLPVTDGYALAGRIRALDVITRPGIIVTYSPGMARTLDITGVIVIPGASDAAAILAAADSVAVGCRRPSAVIVSKLDMLLDTLGIPEHAGRKYLADAAFLASEDMGLISCLTGKLYPMVAARHGVKNTAVERAMRRVIEEAWRYGSIEKQYEIFKGTIDAVRGKPTCGEMIARLSQLLRREV